LLGSDWIGAWGSALEPATSGTGWTGAWKEALEPATAGADWTGASRPCDSVCSAVSGKSATFSASGILTTEEDINERLCKRMICLKAG